MFKNRRVRPKRAITFRSSSNSQSSTENGNHDQAAAVLGRISLLPAPIFPGGQNEDEAEQRRQINAIIEEMEASSPVPSPLAPAARDLLVGDWELIYASVGTVVTKSAVGSILRGLRYVPYVGLNQVDQKLVSLSDSE